MSARGTWKECIGTSTPGVWFSETNVNLHQTEKIAQEMPAHVHRASNDGSRRLGAALFFWHILDADKLHVFQNSTGSFCDISFYNALEDGTIGDQ